MSVAYVMGTSTSIGTVLLPLTDEDELALAAIYEQNCGWDLMHEVQDAVAAEVLAKAPLSSWRPTPA